MESQWAGYLFIQKSKVIPKFLFKAYNLLNGKFEHVSAKLFNETPYGGILWFKYIRAFTANIKVPPIGFFMGTALTQSNGKFDTLQITGCTFCCKFNETAAIAQVSLRTATLLKIENI